MKGTKEIRNRKAKVRSPKPRYTRKKTGNSKKLNNGGKVKKKEVFF